MIARYDSSKKCRGDQAWHKYGPRPPSKGCQGLALGHQKRIHQTPNHPEQRKGSALEQRSQIDFNAWKRR